MKLMETIYQVELNISIVAMYGKMMIYIYNVIMYI